MGSQTITNLRLTYLPYCGRDQWAHSLSVVLFLLITIIQIELLAIHCNAFIECSSFFIKKNNTIRTYQPCITYSKIITHVADNMLETIIYI
jgi:hypothetical protein